MLQLYILRQLSVSFLFAVGGMLFLALPGIAVSAVHRLPNTDMAVMLKLVPLMLQNLWPYVLPIGFLLAVVATYGRLAADNEWTAIQMAGFRPLSMLRPGLYVALVLALGTYWMVATQLPSMKKREKEFLLDALRSSIANISPGQNSVAIGGFGLNGFRDGELFRDAYISEPGRAGLPPRKIFARTARLLLEQDVLYVELTGAQTVGPDVGMYADAEETTIVVPLKEVVETGERSFRSPRYMTSQELARRLADPKTGPEQRREFTYELHHRWALSAMFFVFLGLGASTGLILRRGTQLAALAVSIGYSLVYYVFSMRLGKELSHGALLPPAIGAWTTEAVGGAAALLLLRRASRR